MKTNLSLEVNLNSPEGNIYFILTKAVELLNSNGYRKYADDIVKRVVGADSYKDALRIIEEYINVKYNNSHAYQMK